MLLPGNHTRRKTMAGQVFKIAHTRLKYFFEMFG